MADGQRLPAAMMLLALAVGLVLALALLVLHDAALLVELRLVDRAEQVAHAVGLEPQREVERVLRHGLEVVGAVVVGRAVHAGRADLLERIEELAVQVLRALEHQVLEQVREAGLAGFSFLQPTWYQTLTATIGALWSSCTISVRPCSSTELRERMSTSAASDERGAHPFATSCVLTRGSSAPEELAQAASRTRTERGVGTDARDACADLPGAEALGGDGPRSSSGRARGAPG